MKLINNNIPIITNKILIGINIEPNPNKSACQLIQYVTPQVYQIKALCNPQNPNVLLHIEHTIHGIIGNATKFSAINKCIPNNRRITCNNIILPAIIGAYFKQIILALCIGFILLRIKTI